MTKEESTYLFWSMFYFNVLQFWGSGNGNSFQNLMIKHDKISKVTHLGKKKKNLEFLN